MKDEIESIEGKKSESGGYYLSYKYYHKYLRTYIYTEIVLIFFLKLMIENCLEL